MVETGSSIRSANIIPQKYHTHQPPTHKPKQQSRGPSAPFLDIHPPTMTADGKGLRSASFDVVAVVGLVGLFVLR